MPNVEESAESKYSSTTYYSPARASPVEMPDPSCEDCPIKHRKCMVMVGTRWEVQYPQCLLHTNRAKRCGHGIAPPCSFPASLGCLYVLPILFQFPACFPTTVLQCSGCRSPSLRLGYKQVLPNPIRDFFKLVIEVWLAPDVIDGLPEHFTCVRGRGRSGKQALLMRPAVLYSIHIVSSMVTVGC